MGKHSDKELAEPADISMRRFTSSALPAIPSLAAPLCVRIAQIDESDKMAAILGRAYPTESWESAATEIEIFHDKSIKAPLVISKDDQILATATLQIRPDNPKRGLMRWVATEVDHRRQGLAQAIVVSVLKTAADEDCEEVRLKTTTDLLGAIALYLKLGFEPIIETEDDGHVWKRLHATLETRS